jgi:hypothetical protein
MTAKMQPTDVNGIVQRRVSLPMQRSGCVLAVLLLVVLSSAESPR